jgi:hypothetical protein
VGVRGFNGVLGMVSWARCRRNDVICSVSGGREKKLGVDQRTGQASFGDDFFFEGFRGSYLGMSNDSHDRSVTVICHVKLSSLGCHMTNAVPQLGSVWLY